MSPCGSPGIAGWARVTLAPSTGQGRTRTVEMHDSSTARDVRPIATITEPEAVRPGHTRFVAAIESSPRGSFIVVGFLHVALWTPATGDRSGAGACPCDVVESLAWGQDGQPGPWRSTWRSSAPVPNQGCAGEWSEERFRRSRGLRPRVPTGSTGSAVTRASGRPGSRGRGNSDPRGAVSVSGRPGHPPCRRGVVQLVVKERAKEGCGDGRGGEGPPPRVRCRATSLPTRDWEADRHQDGIVRFQDRESQILLGRGHVRDGRCLISALSDYS